MEIEKKTNNLPKKIPIFPLSEALLLPRAVLPLNIFEPRYISLVDVALASNRLIGMVQPLRELNNKPQIYSVGCAGKIKSFLEITENRYMIELFGISRFKIIEEIDSKELFRIVFPEWKKYEEDLLSPEEENLDISDFLGHLKKAFENAKIQIDWESLSSATKEQIINSLSQIYPFDSYEKQTILEAEKLVDRMKIILSLIKMKEFNSNLDTNLVN